jgi:glycosyltransferase involved in cell wall biosynthesis
MSQLELGSQTHTQATVRDRLSVIVPIYNEEGNIALLMQRLFAVLRELNRPFEVIAVNDGSADGSIDVLRREAENRPELKVVKLSRNYGQTAAMMAGIDHSNGEIIVAIDADLQNDPNDIPRLLSKLDEGYDVVSGWRADRKDARFSRNLVSRVANRVISYISAVPLHDYGCTLKAYRRSVLDGVRLYGEMHRFVPIFAAGYGARIAEIPVQHFPRHSGQSKYGLERIFKVVLDLIVVKFLHRYQTKPIYLFGGLALASLAISALAFLYMIYLKLAEGVSMIQTPLPLVTVMTFLVGAMSLLMGLLAEVVVRTYFESQQKRIYHVRELINFQ